MSTKKYSRVIHWFRRDLRLTDNTALHAASLASDEVVTVYVVSAWKGSHHWTGPVRQGFLTECLGELEEEVKQAGGRLIFREGEAVEELEKLVRETKAEAVFYNKDPDPYGQAVEGRLHKKLSGQGVGVEAFKDVTLHERDEVLTAGGKPYRVFTPYRRNWEQLAKPPVLPAVRRLGWAGSGVMSGGCPALSTWGLQASGAKVAEGGEKAGRARMRRALDRVIGGYAQRRNTPSGETTSGLSADLRMGTISVRELYAEVTSLAAGSADAEVKRGCHTYVGELAWRDFYMQILYHFPEVLKEEFDEQWRGLPWSWDEKIFNRWKEGTTGFPIVDAGMRELAATGRMHNRVRMITAMFLCKDLRIDWRMGEQYFMQALVDGEIASNNGGWQWSAGTGADAAPYFRIQNPWTQTKSYDPEGKYIRHWVPELKSAPMERLLGPPDGKRGGGGGLFDRSYPEPMVDHAEERANTLEMFKKHRERGAARQ
ncbi:MAG: deoxyribodipyrimidine photo-lyase type [Verrucomicrobiales bacterium]|nr:deoxyribodipyrimidine photo-lyase type [Verrucomicrobiales bacterium]